VSFARDDRGRFRWTRFRRLSQLLFVAFFIALPFANRHGVVEVLGTLASLDLGPLSLVDPAVGLSSILASGTIRAAFLGGLVLPVVLALALGPVFCSWVCPWGLLSEMIDKMLRRQPRRIPTWLGGLRWGTLAAFLGLSAVLGLPLVTTLSAPRLITALPLEMIFLGAASIGTVSLLAFLLILEFVLPRRLWCRALCPVGSVQKLLRTPWTLRVNWRSATCDPKIEQLKGRRVCLWNLDPRFLDSYSGCTNCGACVESCPGEPKPSLYFAFGRRAPDTTPAGPPVVDLQVHEPRK
jgi:ferredoxin-type protein NapH